MDPTPLRLARDEQGMTKAALARRAGITRQAYQNYESGKRLPPYKTMKALAGALNTTVEKLFG